MSDQPNDSLPQRALESDEALDGHTEVPDETHTVRPEDETAEATTHGELVEAGARPPQETPAEPAGQRQGWSYFAATVIVLGAAALAIGVIQQFSGVIAPAFLALNLLLVTYPIHRFLSKRGVPGILAALIAGLVVFLILILGLASLVWSVSAMIQGLSGYSAEFMQLYYSTLDFLAEFGLDQDMLLAQLSSISPSNVLDAISGVISGASNASGVLLVLLLTLVFMVMDLPSLSDRFRITNRLHPNFVGAIASLTLGIRRYWVVTTVFGAIVAVMDFGVLLLVGVPMPLTWAVLAFVTNYIPNVGFVLGLLPPALLALMEKGPVAALVVVVAYSVINFVMQSIIQPKITGDAVGISPLVSLLSLLIWTSVLGPLGALLALPMTLVVKTLLIDNDPRARWVNALISAAPKAEGAGT